MAELVYSAIASFDGCTADAGGNFDWAEPDAEVHAFVNDLERSIGTNLYGRRMYEAMVYWEAPPGLEDQPSFVRDYASIWQAADKVVYSTTLEAVSSAKTQLERDFDPEAVRRLKGSAEASVGSGRSAPISRIRSSASVQTGPPARRARRA